MIEFGARLNLRDNMSAVLQRNLQTQRRFSEQIRRTTENVRAFGRARVAPVIQVRDRATQTVNRVRNGLRNVGRTIARPFVAIRDIASPIVSRVGNSLKTIGKFIAKPIIAVKDMATAGLSKIKNLLGTLAKGASIAVGVAGAGVSAIAGGAISEGAKLQQSKGGVETLYGDDASKTVLDNANKAYQTAGLSANAYMETVTSFSASLLNSLGGDTAKSAEIADMAIIDMADNANKFGTDMESIQNTYQGFAKQNYTMLDNLKLGYGGTQEEMERLLKDAQKITGVKYDIKNLADVYSAVHVIQDNLGVAGATALEASSTFSGAFSAMKASAQNFLGALSTGGDVEGTMSQMIQSASTFLFNNAIPMIGNVIKALPTAISTGIKAISPKIKEISGGIVTSLKDGLIALLPSSMGGAVESAFSGITNIVNTVSPLITQLMGMFKRVAPVVQETLGGAFENSGSYFSNFVNMFSSAIPTIENIITNVANVISYVMPIVQSLGSIFASVFPSILEIINRVISTAVPIIERLMGVVQRMMPIIQTVVGAIVTALNTAWSIISPIMDVAMTVLEELMTVVEKVFPHIQNIISTVWEALQPIFEGIASGFSKVKDAISGAGEFIGDGISSVASFFGFAYGKDRVPYDNYPAMLHQGERVLTRNQADQYDRAMSTRGIQLSQTVSEVPRTTGSGVANETVTGVSQSMANTNAGNTNVSIEKLADTVVIQKEADTDKVVADMINKFRKLVPNMA